MADIFDTLGAFARSFTSVNIHLSDHLPCKKEWRQVRFPKSKRKRIRKKWAKDNRRNWALVDVEPVIMQINGAIYCNQLGYDQIKRGIASSNGG
jgi:hypothetical protein